MKTSRLLMCVVVTAQLFLLRLPALAQPSAVEFTRAEISAAQMDPKRFTINPDSVRIVRLGEVEESGMDYVKFDEVQRPLDGVLVSVERIVNIAQKIWKIVDANRPVANISTMYANAYPEGVTAATQLTGWSRPKSHLYGFYAENLYGSVMIDAEYKVTFTYGGTYKGSGKYLAGVTVIPTVADVAWGYKFYMSAFVPDSALTNTGTYANPVAAMQLKLSWKMATILKESDGTSVYYMQGDGYYDEIASPWKFGADGELRDAFQKPPYASPQQAMLPCLEPLPFGLSEEKISQLQWN